MCLHFHTAHTSDIISAANTIVVSKHIALAYDDTWIDVMQQSPTLCMWALCEFRHSEN